MKTEIKYIIEIFLILGFLLGNSSNIIGQEAFELSNYRVRFTFNTSKDTDNNRQLELIYLATNKKDRKDRLPITEAPIQFLHKANDSTFIIGEVLTDKNGVAKLTIPKTVNLIADEEGYYNFTAAFKGTKALKRQKKSLAVKELNLDLNLIERDSSQFVSVKAATK